MFFCWEAVGSMGNLGNDWVMLQVLCLSTLHGCCLWWPKTVALGATLYFQTYNLRLLNCTVCVWFLKILTEPTTYASTHTHSPVCLMDRALFFHPVFLVILGISSLVGSGSFYSFAISEGRLHFIMLRSPLNLHMSPRVSMQTVRHYPAPWWGCSHLFSLAMCNVKGLPWVSWRRQ